MGINGDLINTESPLIFYKIIPIIDKKKKK